MSCLEWIETHLMFVKFDCGIMHIDTSFPFWKGLNMTSLIANKVKTNICFSFNKTLFIVGTNLCIPVHTYTMCTILTIKTIHSLFLTAYNLFPSQDYSLHCLQPFCKLYTYSLYLHSGHLQTRNFTQGWLNYNRLLQQNELLRIFLWRLSLSRYLENTLWEKIILSKVSQKYIVSSRP